MLAQVSPSLGRAAKTDLDRSHFRGPHRCDTFRSDAGQRMCKPGCRSAARAAETLDDADFARANLRHAACGVADARRSPERLRSTGFQRCDSQCSKSSKCSEPSHWSKSLSRPRTDFQRRVGRRAFEAEQAHRIEQAPPANRVGGKGRRPAGHVRTTRRVGAKSGQSQPVRTMPTMFTPNANQTMFWRMTLTVSRDRR